MRYMYLSPLNRDVSVGCLYDYNSAAILPEFLKITSENVDRSSNFRPAVRCITFTSDDSEKNKLFSFGIEHHLSRLLHSQKLEMNRLWFYNYLKDGAFNSCNNNEVQITAYLKFTRRTESLKDDFVRSNMWNYRDNSHDGTHLVTEVEYGAEFVLWMSKSVDPSKETKQSVEKVMHFELKTYLKNFFRDISSPPILNKALFCSFQGSVGNGCVSNVSFEQCLRMIRELTDTEVNDRLNIWRPVRMRLLRIPTKVEIQMAIDLYGDIVYDFNDVHQWVTQQCQYLITSPYLHRLPTLNRSLVVVQELFEKIASAFNKVIDDLQGKQYLLRHYESITDPYTNLLDSASTWLTKFYKDFSKVTYVLAGNNLQVLDLRSTTNPTNEVRYVKPTKVFLLHFRCITIDLDTRFEKWTKNPAKNLCVFDSLTSSWPKVTWENVNKEWRIFLNEANHAMDNDVDYAVGILSPNSLYKEGNVITMGNAEIVPTVNCPPNHENFLPNFPHWALGGGQKRFREDSGGPIVHPTTSKPPGDMV